MIGWVGAGGAGRVSMPACDTAGPSRKREERNGETRGKQEGGKPLMKDQGKQKRYVRKDRED